MSTHVRSLVILFGLCAAGIDAPLPAQDPQQLRARLEHLQEQERRILDHRAWWIAQLRDPDVLLLPYNPRADWEPERNLPRMMRRTAAWEMAQRMEAAFIAMRHPNPATAQELMRHADEQSQAMKESFEKALLPALERDLQAVRTEFQQLMQQRTQQGQTPSVGPAGRAWYFRRAVVGADQQHPDFTLIDEEADENGGKLQVRGRVPSTNCFETWEMRWRFGQNVSRLQQGMVIPVALETQLVSAPCPSPLGSFISVGGAGTERFILNSAPSPVPVAAACIEEGPRAQADGRTQYGSANAVIRVQGNPGQSNAWTVFRLQIYMPGHFWAVGYIYLAGGG